MSATVIRREQLAHVVEGRLTLTTGVPVTNSDVNSAGTIYFTPYLGSRIALLVGSRWVLRSFTEKSLTCQASLFRIMDVWGYDNAGTLGLEQTAWDSGGQSTGTITAASNATPVVITSNSHGLSNGTLVGISGIGGNTYPNGKVWFVRNVTTNTFELEGSTGNGAFSSNGTWYVVPVARTTAIVLTGTNASGVYTKTGDPTRRYLGSYMTFETSGQTYDSLVKRLVFNNYNRQHRSLLRDTGAGIGSYTTSAWRFHQLDATNRFELLVGILEDAYALSWGGIAYGGDGYLSVTANAIAGLTPGIRNANASYINVGQNRIGYPSLGYNFVQAVEFGAASWNSASPTMAALYPM